MFQRLLGKVNSGAQRTNPATKPFFRAWDAHFQDIIQLHQCKEARPNTNALVQDTNAASNNQHTKKQHIFGTRMYLVNVTSGSVFKWCGLGEGSLVGCLLCVSVRGC